MSAPTATRNKSEIAGQIAWLKFAQGIEDALAVEDLPLADRECLRRCRVLAQIRAGMQRSTSEVKP